MTGIAWAEARPLHGRTVAVTRARAQASTLVARLRDLGARVVECPTIRIETIEGEPLRGSDFDLVCVTSPNTPRLLLDRLGGDARALAGCRVAAIGPGTAAALRACGIVADVVAERSVGEGLVEALGPDLRGVRALVARAEDARDTLPDGLRAAGALVEVVPLYRTLRDVPRDLEVAWAADVVAFSAASTVRNFVAALDGRPLDHVRAVSIGPVTSEACRAHGIEVVAEARDHDSTASSRRSSRCSREAPRRLSERGRTSASSEASQRQVLSGVMWVLADPPVDGEELDRSASPQSVSSPVAVSRSGRRANRWLSLSGGGGEAVRRRRTRGACRSLPERRERSVEPESPRKGASSSRCAATNAAGGECAPAATA